MENAFEIWLKETYNLNIIKADSFNQYDLELAWYFQQDKIERLKNINKILVEWKGEIDEARIVYGLDFPDDYNDSPKYAVETLIQAVIDKATELCFRADEY